METEPEWNVNRPCGLSTDAKLPEREKENVCERVRVCVCVREGVWEKERDGGGKTEMCVVILQGIVLCMDIRVCLCENALLWVSVCESSVIIRIVL